MEINKRDFAVTLEDRIRDIRENLQNYFAMQCDLEGLEDEESIQEAKELERDSIELEAELHKLRTIKEQTQRMTDAERASVIGSADGDMLVTWAGDAIRVKGTNIAIYGSFSDIEEAMKTAQKNLKGFLPFVV